MEEKQNPISDSKFRAQRKDLDYQTNNLESTPQQLQEFKEKLIEQKEIENEKAEKIKKEFDEIESGFLKSNTKDNIQDTNEELACDVYSKEKHKFDQNLRLTGIAFKEINVYAPYIKSDIKEKIIVGRDKYLYTFLISHIQLYLNSFPVKKRNKELRKIYSQVENVTNLPFMVTDTKLIDKFNYLTKNNRLNQSTKQRIILELIIQNIKNNNNPWNTLVYHIDATKKVLKAPELFLTELRKKLELYKNVNLYDEIYRYTSTVECNKFINEFNPINLVNNLINNLLSSMETEADNLYVKLINKNLNHQPKLAKVTVVPFDDDRIDIQDVYGMEIPPVEAKERVEIPFYDKIDIQDTWGMEIPQSEEKKETKPQLNQKETKNSEFDFSATPQERKNREKLRKIQDYILNNLNQDIKIKVTSKAKF